MLDTATGINPPKLESGTRWVVGTILLGSKRWILAAEEMHLTARAWLGAQQQVSLLGPSLPGLKCRAAWHRGHQVGLQATSAQLVGETLLLVLTEAMGSLFNASGARQVHLTLSGVYRKMLNSTQPSGF
jgi:hypothetical protein